MAGLRSTFYAHNPRPRRRYHAGFRCHRPTATCSAASAGSAARSGSAGACSGTAGTRRSTAGACSGSPDACSDAPGARPDAPGARSGAPGARSDADDRTRCTELGASEDEAACSSNASPKKTCRTRRPPRHLRHRQWLARVSYPRSSGILLHRSRLLLSLSNPPLAYRAPSTNRQAPIRRSTTRRQFPQRWSHAGSFG